MYDGKTPRVTGAVQPVHCVLLCRTGKPSLIKPTMHTKKKNINTQDPYHSLGESEGKG